MVSLELCRGINLTNEKPKFVKFFRALSKNHSYYESIRVKVRSFLGTGGVRLFPKAQVC
jgi:hypothetical protein